MNGWEWVNAARVANHRSLNVGPPPSGDSDREDPIRRSSDLTFWRETPRIGSQP